MRLLNQVSCRLFIYYDLCAFLLMLILVSIPLHHFQYFLTTLCTSSTLSVAVSGLSMLLVHNNRSSSGDWDPKVLMSGHFPLKSKLSSNLSLHIGSRAFSSMLGNSNPVTSEAGDSTMW